MAEKKAQAAPAPPADPYKGLPTFERMFRKQLDEMNVKLDAFIFTPPVDWMEKQYFYRLTWPGGDRQMGVIPFDVATFATILEEAKRHGR